MNVDIVQLTKDTFSSWSKDKAPNLAAALSYYTVFSLAPLILVLIGIVGLVFGQSTAQHQILGEMQQLIGANGTQTVRTMIESQQSKSANIISTIIGIVTLILGASGVFTQLKSALNQIWHVEEPPKKGIMGMIQSNFLSFSMLLAVGFLLVVSLVLSAVLTAIGAYFQHLFPFPAPILETINFVVSFIVITLMFAMIYRFLPAKKIAWRDVWIGALVTALLFTVGKFLIGLYISHSASTSKYGAAGSLVVILLWVYYSAQIFFLGAEFTKVYANTLGSYKNSVVEAEYKMTLPKKTSSLAVFMAYFVEGFMKGLGLKLR